MLHDLRPNPSTVLWTVPPSLSGKDFNVVCLLMPPWYVELCLFDLFSLIKLYYINLYYTNLCRHLTDILDTRWYAIGCPGKRTPVQAGGSGDISPSAKILNRPYGGVMRPLRFCALHFEYA